MSVSVMNTQNKSPSTRYLGLKAVAAGLFGGPEKNDLDLSGCTPDILGPDLNMLSSESFCGNTPRWLQSVCAESAQSHEKKMKPST